MIVNICGVKHKVIECEDAFDLDTHFGQIDYAKCEIKINKNMSEDNKKESLCHEIVHGILVHIGESEMSQDERFVQALANAIYQSFDVKAEERDMEWVPAIGEMKIGNVDRR